MPGERKLMTATCTLGFAVCQAWSGQRPTSARVRPRLLRCLLLCLGLVVVPLTAQTSATLEVAVSGIESAEGRVGIAVWDDDKGFPEAIEHALDSTYVAVESGTARAVFELPEPGTYAVTVFHDKNDNQRFDKNWIGMPREAWGVSNQARPRLRAPRFDEAEFEISGVTQVVEIRIE